MKQMKFFALVLTFLMGVSLTSCIDEGESSTAAGSIVKVVNYMGTVHFEGANGIKYYPTTASLATVESTYKFSTSSNVAYIYFSSAVANTSSTGQTTDSYTVELTYAVSLDSKTEMPSARGASNDSVSTAPIITLTAGGSNNVFMMDKQLVLGATYYTSKLHYFTLVYYPEETTATSSELNLYLRHNSKGDTSKDATSYDYVMSNLAFMPLYYKAFDLSRIIYDFQMNTGKTTFTINVETQESSMGIILDDATTKKYTLTYKEE
jgi:hypothetical protein